MVVWPHLFVCRVPLLAPCGMSISVCMPTMSHFARWWPAFTHVQAFNVPVLLRRSMGKPLHTSTILHCHHTCHVSVLLYGGLDTPVHIPAVFQGPSVLKRAGSHCCYVINGMLVCIFCWVPCCPLVAWICLFVGQPCLAPPYGCAGTPVYEPTVSQYCRLEAPGDCI